MYLKPRSWFILSLLLFAAAAFFWHIGEKRRQAANVEAAPGSASVRAGGFVLTNVPSPGAPATAAIVPPTTLADPLARAIAVANARTNPFAYRLTNTARA